MILGLMIYDCRLLIEKPLGLMIAYSDVKHGNSQQHVCGIGQQAQGCS